MSKPYVSTIEFPKDDKGFNYHYKRWGWVGKRRMEEAAMYRKLRQDRPEMARLLYKRERFARLLLSGVNPSEARAICRLAQK